MFIPSCVLHMTDEVWILVFKLSSACVHNNFFFFFLPNFFPIQFFNYQTTPLSFALFSHFDSLFPFSLRVILFLFSFVSLSLFSVFSRHLLLWCISFVSLPYEISAPVWRGCRAGLHAVIKYVPHSSTCPPISAVRINARHRTVRSRPVEGAASPSC